MNTPHTPHARSFIKYNNNQHNIHIIRVSIADRQVTMRPVTTAHTVATTALANKASDWWRRRWRWRCRRATVTALLVGVLMALNAVGAAAQMQITKGGHENTTTTTTTTLLSLTTTTTKAAGSITSETTTTAKPSVASKQMLAHVISNTNNNNRQHISNQPLARVNHSSQRQLQPQQAAELPPGTFYEYCLAHRNSFADLATLVLYSLVCVVGLFGNTLVIYVVLRYSKMQTVTNIYILNLAVADECFLIGIPFLLYTMRICSWRFGDFMCKAYMVSTSITQFTSSIFLLIMSADRYLAVCHPIASPKYRTQHIAKVVSALAWLTSAVLMLPVILYASTVSQEDGVNLSCNIEWPETYKKHSATTFTLYTFLLGFATPLCFILCFYYLVIRKLHAVGSKHKSKEKKRSHRKVTRLVLTVITVYILCWLPYWISQVALIHSNPSQNDLSRLEILIFLLLGCLVYSNSAMNPILYAFLSDNFRKSFFKAFTCMNQHDVNAQLHAEPSGFTKQGSRRRGPKRLLSQQLKKPQRKNATNTNNNSSTTTSSTTTAAAEKTTTPQTNTTTATTTATATAVAELQQPNGRPPAAEAGDMILMVEQERTVCELMEQTDDVASASCVLQTDL